MSSATLQNLSSDLAAAAEAVGPSVVAVHAQHRIPSSGIQWCKDVIVTVNHGIRRNEDISVLLGPEKSVPATLAGRDPSTDLAILKDEHLAVLEQRGGMAREGGGILPVLVQVPEV